MDGWAPSGPRQGTAGAPAAMPCRGPGCPRQGIAKGRASLGKRRQGSGCPRRSFPKGPAGLGKAVPRARRPSVRPARLPTRSLPRTGRPRAWPRQSRPATTRPPATRPRRATAAPRENSADGPSAADTAGPATRHPDRLRNTATAPTAPGEVSPDPTPSSGRRHPRPLLPAHRPGEQTGENNGSDFEAILCQKTSRFFTESENPKRQQNRGAH